MYISPASLALLTAAVICFEPWAAVAMPQGPSAGAAPAAATPQTLLHPDERHFGSLRQLTFGGENAEAYFSFDGRRLSLQATTAQDRCDQIYYMDLEGGTPGAAPVLHPVSQGHGRHTCSYFFPAGDRLLFSSTRHLGDACP